MDVGQVGFHNPKMVHTVRVEELINEIVNRLNRTKVERKPDLKGKRREEMERLDKERQAEVRSYKNLMVAEKMTSNNEIASANKSLQELEEDIM
ncbi:unnamed protein product [Camellia sinensis]